MANNGGAKEGSTRRRRVRRPAVPPPVLWLVACNAPGGSYTEVHWTRYAWRSNRTMVWRMNRHRYTRGNPRRWDSQTASLSTLGPSVELMRRQAPANARVLCILWHGILITGIQEYFGCTRSTGQALNLDAQRMRSDANWDDRVFPFNWQQRNQNTHYQAAIRALQQLPVQQIHLYGCSLGQSFRQGALLDFAADTGKEVWAYEGSTAISTSNPPSYLRIENTRSGQPADGVREIRSGAYQQVTLSSSRGPLPGWQMRARNVPGQSGTPTIQEMDIYNEVMQQVDVYHRGSRNVVRSTNVQSSAASGSGLPI